MSSYKQGDIVTIRLGGPGNEPEAVRKAVIVSADVINENLQTVIVCPLIAAKEIKTSRIGATFLPKEETGLDLNSLILSLQIRTVAKETIVQKIGSLPHEYHAQVKESLQAVLELDT